MNCVVARLGSERVYVLLPAVRTITVAAEVAARLRAALKAEPVRLEGMSFEIEASVGIALYPDDEVERSRYSCSARTAKPLRLAKERRTGGRDLRGAGGPLLPGAAAALLW